MIVKIIEIRVYLLSLVKSNLGKMFLLVDEILLLRYYVVMTIATVQKLKREIKKELIEEFILPILKNFKDSEDEYKESFVKKVIKVSQEKPKKEFLPTFAQKKALASAENNFKKRKTLSYDKVAQKLGFAN